MEETPAQKWAMVAQWALTTTLGCGAFLIYPPTTNSYERLLFVLLVGFGGNYLIMFAYVWARYGWKAARGMSMGGF